MFSMDTTVTGLTLFLIDGLLNPQLSIDCISFSFLLWDHFIAITIEVTLGDMNGKYPPSQTQSLNINILTSLISDLQAGASLWASSMTQAPSS